MDKHRTTQGGQAATVAVLILVFIVLTLVTSGVTPVLRDAKLARDLYGSSLAVNAADSALEDAVYRLRSGMSVDDDEALTIGEVEVGTAISSDPLGKTVLIKSSAARGSLVRNKAIELFAGGSASFSHTVHGGKGGVSMSGGSGITGDVYSSGPVTSDNNNTIEGNVTSSGEDGLVDGVVVSGSVVAHKINNSTISIDAYYQGPNSANAIAGTSYPESVDAPDRPLPVPDDTLDRWERSFENPAGIVPLNPTCPYNVLNSITIGPGVITCDLIVAADAIVTLRSSVLVEGDIRIMNSATIRVDPTLGDKSVALIAHRNGSEINQGTIHVSDSVNILGSGSPDSVVILVSRNTSAENSGSTAAISIGGTAGGDVVAYAPHGLVTLGGNVSVSAVGAHTLNIANSADVDPTQELLGVEIELGENSFWEITRWTEVE